MNQMKETVKKILENNEKKVRLYKEGQTGLLGLFVGLVMVATKNMLDPVTVNDEVKKQLDEMPYIWTVKVYRDPNSGWKLIDPKNTEGLLPCPMDVVTFKHDDEYCSYLNNSEGGPIISEKTLEASVEKFKEALTLGLSVTNLMKFSDDFTQNV